MSTHNPLVTNSWLVSFGCNYQYPRGLWFLLYIIAIVVGHDFPVLKNN
jgi:hypothetical protein